MSVYSKTLVNKPGKSFFKGLSHSVTFTADMGQLIPVDYEECYPGDVFKIGSECVVRFMPMVAPILHEVNVIVSYFFVPFRLISNDSFDWETFITGGKDGKGLKNGVEQILPRWDVSADKHGVGSLWDYFGFSLVKPEAACLPYEFPRFAYNLIYNEYYRDENLMDEVSLTNEDVLYRCWKKDYFTSALISQQRGQAPALPGDIMYLGSDGNYHSVSMANLYAQGVSQSNSALAINAAGTIKSGYVHSGSSEFEATSVVVGQPSGAGLAPPKDNFSKIVYTGADVADLRLANQVQRWMERNNRGGYRLTEVLRSHFGVSPADDRMQRPEYIGGYINPIIFSEVLQTSQTVKTGDNQSVQGNMAGHGLSANATYVGKYRVKEHGCIIGLFSVMPKNMYTGQGINRQFLRRNRFDFYWPEFASLSEQAIENAELFVRGTSDDYGVFGYQGRFNELRTHDDRVSGLMRLSGTQGGFAFWHLGRIFENAPALNADFVRADQIRKDFLAVDTQPAMVVSYGNVINAVRPIPRMPVPALRG